MNFIAKFIITLLIMYFIYILHGSFVGLDLEARNVSLTPLVTNEDHISKSTLHSYPSSKCIQVNFIKSNNSYTFVVFYNHHQCLAKLFLNIRSGLSETKRQNDPPISRWLSFRNYLNQSIPLLLSGDIELNPGHTRREEFMKLLDQKQTDPSTNIQSIPVYSNTGFF